MTKRKRNLILTGSFMLMVLLCAAFAGISSGWLNQDPGSPAVAPSGPDTTLNSQPASNDSVYRFYLRSADKLVREKKYADALDVLDNALKLKPDDDALKTRILQVKDLDAQQKKQDAEYAQLIQSADKYFSAKAYLDAKATYQLALNLKPGDPYATGKMNETMGYLRSQKAQNILYDVAVANADKFFEAGELDKAKAEYEKATQILPGDQHARERINEIIKIQVDRQVREELYAQAITRGDQLYNQKKYPGALTEFKNALKQKPDEKYPQDRVKELTDLLNLQKAKDESYQKALAAADQLFTAKRYPEAKTGYQEALKIKPEETYPKNRIREIDLILADLKRSAEEYEMYITLADSFYIDKNFVRARQHYQLALQIKPGEAYPKEMLSKTDQAAAGQEQSQKALEEAYAAAIRSADLSFGQKAYEQARKEYNSALVLKPAEAYPVSRMAEIDRLLGDLAARAATEEKYMRQITVSDSLFAAGQLSPARAGYSAALALKPGETYPKNKMAEIDASLETIAKQKSLDEKYQSAITEADRLLEGKSYDPAAAKYRSALALKPAEEYPKTKIAEIEGILAAEAAERKEMEENYRNLLSEADRLFAGKAYAESKKGYQDALSLKPDEKYPVDQIARIDDELARQKGLEDRYLSAIADADRLFGEKSWAGARSKYQSALTVKPDESYPKSRIAAVDSILSVLAKQKELDELYTSILGKGDAAFTAKNWDAASDSYTQALTLKPGEAYPQGRLDEIGRVKDELARQKDLDDRYAGMITEADKLFASKSWNEAKKAYADASSLKPGEAYPKSRMADVDSILDGIARQAALDKQYTELLSEADRLLASKSYAEARKAYADAAGLKPEESYPKTKVTEIDQILARIRAVEDQYTGIIAGADGFLAAKSYAEAKTEYQKALKVKPDEPYPQQKIDEIDATLAELARQKTIDDQFRVQVNKADQLFNAKQYESARNEYLAAQKIRETDSYPKNRIEEIDAILAEIKARDESYRASVARADQLLLEKNFQDARAEFQNASAIKPSEQYPKDKIGEINRLLTELQGKKVTYDNLLKTAADQLEEKEYFKSKDLYEQASGIFPEETYPKERIAFITRTVDSIYRANKGKYDVAVANGDKFFNSFEFDKAIDAYTEASSYLPMESYPKEQVARIRRSIAENAIVDVLKSSVTITAGDEKRFSFEPVNIAARKDNFIYLKVRNLSEKPFNILMRYGQDAQANGGVVIRNVTTDGKVNERLISVRDQDLWYRSDNNWISLYPQGGDIEVSFIQVSKVR